jgi:putative SOS response-associated peptidase YedK
LLALRKLGPLCPGWQAAGLTAAAVFEDPLDVALRVARRLGWAGLVLSQAPPYATSRAYGLAAVPTGLVARYNVAPTQLVAAVGLGADRVTRALVKLRWGLVPYWANDLKGPPLVNARAESVAGKFPLLFRERRCLVCASGFFEWATEDRKKRARNFTLPDRAVFGFAGLWDVWDGGDESIASTCIITTTPNELVSAVHDRMPVILRREDYAEWLNPQTPEKRLRELLAPYPADLMTARVVGPKVNSPKNDGPECLDAA